MQSEGVTEGTKEETNVQPVKSEAEKEPAKAEVKEVELDMRLFHWLKEEVVRERLEDIEEKVLRDWTRMKFQYKKCVPSTHETHFFRSKFRDLATQCKTTEEIIQQIEDDAALVKEKKLFAAILNDRVRLSIFPTFNFLFRYYLEFIRRFQQRW
ncbi:hypothetical protein M1146_05765 [Patescibacteria group bacterium]|nr:hypothetical protein [Patescibacteria group bacterium]